MEITGHAITMYVDAPAGTESDDEELALDNGDAVFQCSCGTDPTRPPFPGRSASVDPGCQTLPL